MPKFQHNRTIAIFEGFDPPLLGGGVVQWGLGNQCEELFVNTHQRLLPLLGGPMGAWDRSKE